MITPANNQMTAQQYQEQIVKLQNADNIGHALVDLAAPAMQGAGEKLAEAGLNAAIIAAANANNVPGAGAFVQGALHASPHAIPIAGAVAAVVGPPLIKATLDAASDLAGKVKDFIVAQWHHLTDKA